jgi:D-3-phosphoglycerate dehydrogenase
LTLTKNYEIHGVGVDNIDLKAATERKIFVANAPGTNTEAVADLAFTLLLGVARKVIKAYQMVSANHWGNVIGYELYGKTLGLIGFGSGSSRRLKMQFLDKFIIRFINAFG